MMILILSLQYVIHNNRVEGHYIYNYLCFSKKWI